jgi:hypothetical protein
MRVDRLTSSILDGSGPHPQDSGDRAAFLNAFAAAPRRLGKGDVVLAPEERVAWEGTALLGGTTVDEVGRFALLLSLPEGAQDDLAGECYRHGEIRERRAVLRALGLFPRPERFVPLAVDACRSHVQSVFEAISCENPFPAAFFPDAALHQMVIKALFTGVALDRVVGLRARISPELARMAHGYASERRAAGRSVPADIELYFPESTLPAERSD